MEKYELPALVLTNQIAEPVAIKDFDTIKTQLEQVISALKDIEDSDLDTIKETKTRFEKASKSLATYRSACKQNYFPCDKQLGELISLLNSASKELDKKLPSENEEPKDNRRRTHYIKVVCTSAQLESILYDLKRFNATEMENK